MGVYLENTSNPHVPTPLNIADSMYLRERPDLSQEQIIVEGQEQSVKENGDAVNFIIAQQGAFRSLWFPGGVATSNADWIATDDGTNVTLSAVGNWIGNVIMLEQGGNLSFEALPDVEGNYTVTFPLSSRRAVFYTMEGGSPVSLTVNAPDYTITEHDYASIASWEVPESTTVNIRMWVKALAGSDSVRFRWLVNGAQYGNESSYLALNPSAWDFFDFPSSHIMGGSTITLQAKSSPDPDYPFTMTGIHLDVSYIAHT